MLWQRVLSAVVLIPIAATIIYLGGWYFSALIIIIGLIGFYEFLNAVKCRKLNVLNGIGYALAVLILATAAIYKYKYISMIIFLYVIISGIIMVTKHKDYSMIEVLKVLFGLLYAPFLISHLIVIRNVSDLGFSLTWLCFLCTWGCDTFAYFSGRLFGKKKLCPEVSPKKTVEGAIGGMIGCFLICMLWAYISINYIKMDIDTLSINNIYLLYGLTGIVGGILSQFGDLSASLIKRAVGVKDYGNLIPGHGGVLDRFDSMLFVAPFVYYLMTFIIG